MNQPPPPPPRGPTSRRGAVDRDAYPAPAFRTLRGYALDPRLAQRLQTATISEITLQFPGNARPWSLRRIPRGHRLRSGERSVLRAGRPRTTRMLLAQDGLRARPKGPAVPSADGVRGRDGDHPQLRARARPPALWRRARQPASSTSEDDSNFVQRLRIYPHALREATPTTARQRRRCCSATSRRRANDPGDHCRASTRLHLPLARHHRARDHARAARRHAPPLPRADQPRRARASTRRSPTSSRCSSTSRCPRVLRAPDRPHARAISRQENLLASWRASSAAPPACAARCAMRSAEWIDGAGSGSHRRPIPARVPDRRRAARAGAILVAAIFDAFLAIYEARIADLLRICTGGTGVLPPGPFTPTWSRRLADEAGKAAEHVLTCASARSTTAPGGPDVRRVPARAHHRRHRSRPRRRSRLPRRVRRGVSPAWHLSARPAHAIGREPALAQRARGRVPSIHRRCATRSRSCTSSRTSIRLRARDRRSSSTSDPRACRFDAWLTERFASPEGGAATTPRSSASSRRGPSRCTPRIPRSAPMTTASPDISSSSC